MCAAGRQVDVEPLEHAPSGAHRYRRIGHDGEAIEALFVDLFLDSHAEAPARLVLDLDATDDPLHGRQEGRFFHGYYDCYCYLPLYVFCGDHLLAAKLRRSDINASAGAVEEVERIVGQIRTRWPAVEIVLRADSGFAREPLMAWCEDNAVDFVFGLARNARLAARLQPALDRAETRSRKSGQPAPVHRVPLSHPEDMVALAPRRRQGGVAAGPSPIVETVEHGAHDLVLLQHHRDGLGLVDTGVPLVVA